MARFVDDGVRPVTPLFGGSMLATSKMTTRAASLVLVVASLLVGCAADEDGDGALAEEQESDLLVRKAPGETCTADWQCANRPLTVTASPRQTKCMVDARTGRLSVHELVITYKDAHGECRYKPGAEGYPFERKVCTLMTYGPYSKQTHSWEKVTPEQSCR